MNKEEKVLSQCILCKKVFLASKKHAKYCTKACYMTVMKGIGIPQDVTSKVNMRDFIINLIMAISVLLIAGCVYGYYNYQQYETYTLTIQKI